MSNPKVTVDVALNEKDFTRGAGSAGKSALSLENALKRLGPAGAVIQNVIDKIGLSSLASAAGITAGTGAALAAAEKGITAYVNLGEQIRNYSVLTGQSAEASSRQVQAFQALGVSEETAAAAMFRLSREAAGAPDKLRAVGVEVAKTADGGVDLNKTLLNVADAYQATSDAAQRNRIVFTAFGKAGAAMIPILEANSAELRRLQAQVRQVYTDADIEQVRQYKIATEQLHQATDDFWTALGQRLLPTAKAAVDGLNEYLFVTKAVADAQANGTLKARAGSQAADEFANKVRQEYREAQSAKENIDALARAQKAAADAAQAEANAENALYDSIHKSIDAQDAYKDSINRVYGERLRADQEAANYDKAVQTYGEHSVEANTANLAYRETLRSLAEAYKAEANAAVNMAEQQAAVEGTTLTASQKADIFRQKLQELASQLGPNDPLRQDLQGYINQLRNIPSSVATAVVLTTAAPVTRRAGIQYLAEGGIVTQPTLAVVGESGPEAVIPLDEARRSSPVIHNHFHIEGWGFIDGPNLDALANKLAARLRFAPGT